MNNESSTFDNNSTLYSLLVSILRHVIGWIEESTVVAGVAGHTLDAQVVALSRGWQPTRTWARAIRAALLWADQLTVPLRAGEIVRLEARERTHATDFSRIEVRGRRKRTSRPLRVAYHDGGASLYPVALYRLYVMPGGARDILLSIPGRDPSPCTMFYVPDARRSTSHQLHLRSIQRILEWCLRQAAPRMGTTEDELRRRGAGQAGAFRVAQARALVEAGLTDEAAELLGWSSRVVAASYRLSERRAPRLMLRLPMARMGDDEGR